VEHNADAIGLSALLVSTSKQMPLIVNQLHRRGLNIPVLVGGAAINRRFGRRINRTEDEKFYESGVYYCKDAFEGLETMDLLSIPKTHSVRLATLREEVERELNITTKSKKVDEPGKSGIKPDPIPFPKRLGPRVVKDMPLETIFQHIYKNELFRLSWGAKNAHGDEWIKLRDSFQIRLDLMQKQALEDGWLKPQAVYGYWPCQSDGNDLVIYNPDTYLDSPDLMTRFTFPRQPAGERFCLADYFAPINTGIFDLVAFQVVTVGEAATHRFDTLQDAGDYSEAYYVHGLAVQTAEATAEYLHRHIRRELGLLEDQGKRYSWGYPAIPDLEDHHKVFELLPAGSELGMSLTPAYQLVPEQSTAAIIIHHPEARYFNVGTSRIDQLMEN
jgi:5-methyltetrahydrofolate--homocysteine methyltransferase